MEKLWIKIGEPKTDEEALEQLYYNQSEVKEGRAKQVQLVQIECVSTEATQHQSLFRQYTDLSRYHGMKNYN